jgi:hypothetical protein
MPRLDLQLLILILVAIDVVVNLRIFSNSSSRRIARVRQVETALIESLAEAFREYAILVAKVPGGIDTEQTKAYLAKLADISVMVAASSDSIRIVPPSIQVYREGTDTVLTITSQSMRSNTITQTVRVNGPRLALA